MHGLLRYCLATLVVISHLRNTGYINVGIPAVVVFYILSGYVVTHLIQKYFPPDRLKFFYMERLLRIYPAYLFFLLLTGLFLYFTDYSSPHLTPSKILANLIIIPLNYFMFIDVAVVREFCILPPAWSLGVEMQAYLLLPLIIRSLLSKWSLGLLSLLIFSASAIGILNADIWGYRLLPGILFIFLSGAAICRTVKTPKLSDSFDRRFPIVCWIWLLVLSIGLIIFSDAMTNRLHPFSSATILGFLLGLPIVSFTSNSSLRVPFDRVLGQLSYGLFLIHMPVSWAFEYFFKIPIDSKRSFLFVMITSTLLSAFASYLIEDKVWLLRKKITTVEYKN